MIRSTFAALAVAFLLGVSGCSNSSDNVADTLVYARNRDAVNLDPALAPDGMSLDVVHSMMEGLVSYKPGSFDVEPALATSWTTRAGGTVWTFTLRRDVKFSDGTAFDAAAVKFNFDRWRLRSDTYHTGGEFTYYESQFGGFPGVIKSVTVLAPDTVVLDLSKPMAPLLANLAMPSFSMSSPAAIEKEGENYPQAPVGTGPYELAEWVHDDHITLRANPDYWGPKPKIKTIVIKDNPTADSTLLALQKGDVDGWEYPTPESLPQVRKNPHLRVYHLPANNVMYLAMNELKPPLDDVLVRRAISEAIDRQAIARDFYDPGAFAADDFLPPAVWPQDVRTAYAYDPADARRLLALAGKPNGFTTTLWYMTTPRPYLPEPERVAEAIQADLKAVGINARLEGFEWGNYLYQVQNGEHSLALYGWSGDNGDPDNFLYVQLDKDSANPPGAQNVCFWKNDEFHRLMLEAQTTLDRGRRAAIYRQALAVMHDQAPLVSIVHTAPPTVMDSNVAGFVPRPDTFEDFSAMYFTEGRR